MTAIRAIMAAAGLVVLIAAFLFGRATGIDHERARQAKVLAAAEAKVRAIEKQVSAVSAAAGAALRDQSTEQRTITNEVIRFVQRPDYRGQCIDPDGVGLLDRARAAANRELAGPSAGDAGTAAGDAPPP